MLARIIALAIPPLGSGQTVGPVAETLLLPDMASYCYCCGRYHDGWELYGFAPKQPTKTFSMFLYCSCRISASLSGGSDRSSNSEQGPLGGESITASASTLDGLGSTLFYLATYALATVGLFGGLIYLGHRWPEWSTSSNKRLRLEDD